MALEEAEEIEAGAIPNRARKSSSLLGEGHKAHNSQLGGKKVDNKMHMCPSNVLASKHGNIGDED